MKISAVICETNPIHDGHKYLFHKAHENADCLIAVMSGNYVQRGTCAQNDKYSRAKDVIYAGVDLCVELPFPYSSSSAPYFASAGTHIAKSLGATDLFFGSECASLDALIKSAKILSNNQMFSAGRAAEIREKTLLENFPDVPTSILSSPNDILGVEYCKCSDLKMNPVKRIESISSSHLRIENINNGLYEDYEDKIAQLVFTKLRLSNKKPDTFECSGGVGERMFNMAYETNNYKEWQNIIKTKQYTNSRLRRASLFYLCNVSSESFVHLPLFTKVLAFNDIGRQYLSQIRKNSSLILISNNSDTKKYSGELKSQIDISNYADILYSFIKGKDSPNYYIKKHTLQI